MATVDACKHHAVQAFAGSSECVQLVTSVQLAIKWFRVHGGGGGSGGGDAQATLDALLAENRCLMAVTRSLLWRASGQEDTPTEYAGLRPPADIDLDAANVVVGYSIVGNVPMDVLKKLKRRTMSIDKVRRCADLMTA